MLFGSQPFVCGRVTSDCICAAAAQECKAWFRALGRGDLFQKHRERAVHELRPFSLVVRSVHHANLVRFRVQAQAGHAIQFAFVVAIDAGCNTFCLVAAFWNVMFISRKKERHLAHSVSRSCQTSARVRPPKQDLPGMSSWRCSLGFAERH